MFVFVFVKTLSTNDVSRSVPNHSAVITVTDFGVLFSSSGVVSSRMFGGGCGAGGSNCFADLSELTGEEDICRDKL